MKTCKQITQLASRACDEKIGLMDNIELKLHLMMCKHCYNFAKNNETLHKIMQGYSQEGKP